uniref:Uncharacterized protein n=1 Tax=Anopheles funestus TaxID=62324 RepID=A0A182S3X6_ANOFN
MVLCIAKQKSKSHLLNRAYHHQLKLVPGCSLRLFVHPQMIAIVFLFILILLVLVLLLFVFLFVLLIARTRCWAVGYCCGSDD